MSEKINKEIYTKLATRIYDLDGEVYRVLGSSLGRTFTGNRDTTIRTLSMLMYTKPDGHLLRSELALISNMARMMKFLKKSNSFRICLALQILWMPSVWL